MIRTTHVWILVLVAVFLSGLSTWHRTSSVKQQKSEVVLLLPQDTINFNGVVRIIQPSFVSTKIRRYLKSLKAHQG